MVWLEEGKDAGFAMPVIAAMSLMRRNSLLRCE